ncbi:MAG: protein kinase [Acidimicrobiia bacterium]|nr:protein kinase [Acidimicrobiia bacterium]
MTDDPKREPLPSWSARLRVERACDHFEAAWLAGRRPRLEDHLGATAEPERSALLRELLALELAYRRRSGEQPTPEEYRLRFPEHVELIDKVFGEAPPTIPPGSRPAMPTRPTPPEEGLLPPAPPPAATTSSRNGPGSLAAAAPPPDAVRSAAPPPEAAGRPFGTYLLLEELGRGGMGVVYRAHDRRHGADVALKIMQCVDGASLYRFKQEFRALLDVTHPNLVSLYELASDGRNWFITMELIDGVDFLRHVRSAPLAPGDPDRSALASDGPAPILGPDPLSATVTKPREREETIRAQLSPTGGLDPRPTTNLPQRAAGLPPEGRRRLRDALRQLAEGIAALHAAGKLHRDIKPSNVLVTRTGRVVLLDFGLATERDRKGSASSAEGKIVGTVAYMAPEQAAGLPLSSASDWYSIGVMLYQALTGRLPFLGESLAILVDKQDYEPPPPCELVPDVPEDLNALCVELLRRDPRARPSGREVLRRLGSWTLEPGASPTVTTLSAADLPLIGRDRHLKALAAAFEAVAARRTVVLNIHGRSGVGKSALLQRFLDGLAERDAAVVLAGRCYERESMPFKALDSLIDALSRFLRRLPDHEAQTVMPRDIGPLARAFPVLRRVEAVAAAPKRAVESPDPQERRRRAFAALRELLARLGDRRPLVLAIDDLQWGDADSLAALAEVVRPPDPPVLLLLGCYRSEDAATNPFLRAMLAPSEAIPSALERREVAVEPLAHDESRDLALALLGRADPATRSQAEAIARESGGNPLFITELARAVQDETGGTNPPGEPIALDEVLWSRILRLPDAARRLLEVIAISGHPLRPTVAWRSLGLASDERATLALLRSGRLIRSTALSEGEEVETYHDRVRETIVARLEPEVVRHHHGRLAHTLEASGRADPEVLGVHFQGAGEPEKAAEHYARAAGQAAEVLAFDRAARLYRLALELRPPGRMPADGEARRLRTGLAEALANAGRGDEAAREYLAATAGATVADAFELRRRAAMQFLISGHIDQGLTTLRTVLEAVGLNLPGTLRGALWSFLLGRARLRLRGLRFRERDPSEIAAADLARIDVCWSAVIGLSVVDWIRGADFQARGLLLALRAGEPSRIARALAMEALCVATAGARAARRTAAVLEVAETLVRRTEHPYLVGILQLAKGVAAHLEGRWRAGLDGCDRAATSFRDHCTGVAWKELDLAHSFALWSLIHLGEVAELSRRQPVLLQEAQERGDLYATMNHSTYSLSLVRLASDEPDRARDEIRRMMGPWSRTGYHVQHNDQLWAAVQIELYCGDGRAAWDLLTRHWPALVRSQLLRIQIIRVCMWSLRARAALAAAATADDPTLLLRSAARDARRLAREGVPWSVAHARFIQGLLAAARGAHDEAAVWLDEAAARLEAADMRLCAAAARARRGGLPGRVADRALVADAHAWMADQGIRNPTRMAAMYAPAVNAD